MDLIGGSVWQHTALVFITRKPDERNLRETDNIKKHKWFKDKRGNSWHTFSKDNVNDLIEKLVGAATWYNGTDSCFKANNSAFSQESQMDSRCLEEITKTENGRLQQKNIEPQQATTSIHRGTTPESHHELSSASENTSGQLRKVYNIHTPESQQGQSVVNGNMATLEKVYNKSMATVTSQKKDLARFCRYLTSDEPGSRFVQELKQEDHELYQRLAVTLVNEHREELVQKVTTVRSIADALYSKKMVDNELNSQIQAETTSPGKMRKLYKALNSAEPVKAAFFELLAQKQFPLVQDLAKKKLRQLEACDVDVP
ncbi:uncharacterized protein si:ch211-66k16.27 [Anguilla rostrata]|uniref:uncharacterized protein si:ch211-66k16.27 n=1 Tax=Anguilla rostrata TaxID=7938 RepID=UPI0030D36C9D